MEALNYRIQAFDIFPFGYPTDWIGSPTGESLTVCIDEAHRQQVILSKLNDVHPRGWNDDPQPIEELGDDSFAWAAEHFPELLEKYQGEWILVRDHDVVDHSTDCTELLKRAIGRGIKNPLMLWVETPPIARRSAFLAHGG